MKSCTWTDRYPLPDCPTRINDKVERKLSFFDNNIGRIGPNVQNYEEYSDRYQYSTAMIAKDAGVSRQASVAAYIHLFGKKPKSRYRTGKADRLKLLAYIEENRESLSLKYPNKKAKSSRPISGAGPHQ